MAYKLLDKFSIFGASGILQSDNREFAKSVIEELCSMWEGSKTVYSEPRYSLSMGSVEGASDDTEDILSTWLQPNSTTHWAEGLSLFCSGHEGYNTFSIRGKFGQPRKWV